MTYQRLLLCFQAVAISKAAQAIFLHHQALPINVNHSRAVSVGGHRPRTGLHHKDKVDHRNHTVHRNNLSDRRVNQPVDQAVVQHLQLASLRQPLATEFLQVNSPFSEHRNVFAAAAIYGTASAGGCLPRE